MGGALRRRAAFPAPAPVVRVRRTSMKFHALAICLAGMLVTGAAVRADHTPKHRSDSEAADRYSERDPITGFSVYAGERIFYREVLYPDVQDEREVAKK